MHYYELSVELDSDEDGLSNMFVEDFDTLADATIKGDELLALGAEEYYIFFVQPHYRDRAVKYKKR